MFTKPIDIDVIRISFFPSHMDGFKNINSISYNHNWYCSSVECECVSVGRRASTFIIHCWLVIKLFAIFGRRRCCRHRYYCVFEWNFFLFGFFDAGKIYTFLFSELLSWLIKFVVPFYFCNKKIKRKKKFCVDFSIVL